MLEAQGRRLARHIMHPCKDCLYWALCSNHYGALCSTRSQCRAAYNPYTTRVIGCKHLLLLLGYTSHCATVLASAAQPGNIRTVVTKLYGSPTNLFVRPLSKTASSGLSRGLQTFTYTDRYRLFNLT